MRSTLRCDQPWDAINLEMHSDLEMHSGSMLLNWTGRMFTQKNYYQLCQQFHQCYPADALTSRWCTYVRPEGNSRSLQCGCILLGALTRELDRLQLLSAWPTKPFGTFSFSVLFDAVKNIQSPAVSTLQAPRDTVQLPATINVASKLLSLKMWLMFLV
jgi:hypothetical protein